MNIQWLLESLFTISLHWYYPSFEQSIPRGTDLRDHVTITLLFYFVTSSCSILSFGAPAANKYKMIVDGRDPMLFETSQVCTLSLHLQWIVSITQQPSFKPTRFAEPLQNQSSVDVRDVSRGLHRLKVVGLNSDWFISQNAVASDQS